MHDFRQILIYWQNTVQVVCYEGNRENPGGLPVPIRERQLPVYHDFSFNKVAVEGFALSNRHYRSNQLQLLSSDEDDPDDDDIGDERGRGRRYLSSKTAANSGSSSIKIVRAAKDKAMPQ